MAVLYARSAILGSGGEARSIECGKGSRRSSEIVHLVSSRRRMDIHHYLRAAQNNKEIYMLEKLRTREGKKFLIAVAIVFRGRRVGYLRSRLPGRGGSVRFADGRVVGVDVCDSGRVGVYLQPDVYHHRFAALRVLVSLDQRMIAVRFGAGFPGWRRKRLIRATRRSGRTK